LDIELFQIYTVPLCLQTLLEPFTYLLQIAGKEIRSQLATVSITANTVINPLMCSGVKLLHLKMFNIIQV